MLCVVLSTSFVGLVLLGRNIQDWRNPVRNRITDLSIGTVWVRENAPLESIVMVRDPVPDYLYTRRRTIPYPGDRENIEEYVRVNGIDYIIISPKLQTPRTTELGEYVEEHLLPALSANTESYRVVYADPVHNVAVYEVICSSRAR